MDYATAEKRLTLTFPIICIYCGITTDIVVVMSQYLKWRTGFTFIQNAMPDLTLIEQETLITGLCEKCQPEQTTNRRIKTETNDEHISSKTE